MGAKARRLEDLTQKEAEQHKSGSLAQLRVAFQQEASEDDKNRARSCEQTLRERDGQRKANFRWLCQLDHGLAMSAGCASEAGLHSVAQGLMLRESSGHPPGAAGANPGVAHRL